MADTTFVDQETIIEADWLQDVNELTYNGTLTDNELTIGNELTHKLRLIAKTSPSVAPGGSVTASIITTDGTSGSSFHIGIEIPSNDANDSFFVTTDADQDGTPDTIALQIKANGIVVIPVSLKLAEYTVLTLPSATLSGQMIYVTDETGGAVPAFSDGTNWRRTTDRAIVS